nr:hypothetical protein [uncultured Pedobacter sp.]
MNKLLFVDPIHEVAISQIANYQNLGLLLFAGFVNFLVLTIAAVINKKNAMIILLPLPYIIGAYLCFFESKILIETIGQATTGINIAAIFYFPYGYLIMCILRYTKIISQKS